MPREAADHMSGRHPFDEDPGLYRRIVQVMTGAVQRMLRRGFASPDREPVLPGGASIDDIVAEALSKIWAKDPATVDNYEALAYTIAVRSTIDQLRRSKAYRTYHDAEGNKKEIPVDYLSTPTRPNRQGDEAPAIGETLENDDPTADAHRHFVLTRQALVMGELADALPERERFIFYAVFFEERTRESVAEDVELSAARVGQIYKKTLRSLNAQARGMPEFEAEYADPEGDAAP